MKNTMKNIIGILLLAAGCYSCSDNEVDNVFDKTPEERIAAVKAEYKNILVEAPHGWKTYFGTTDKLGRWLILMDFDADGKVTMKCDPVDYYYIGGVSIEDPVTYRVDYSQFPELVFESFSQFSAWNEFYVDSDGDGYFDKYASPETQFIFDAYRDGKLYMKGKTNMGVGKKPEEIMTFVFEPASEADWTLNGIADVKKAINYNESKGKYQRLEYKGELLESLFLIDAESRVVLYMSTEIAGSQMQILPFYITPTGFTLVSPLKIKGVGNIRQFDVSQDGTAVTESTHQQLRVVYTDKVPAVQRTPFSIFDKLYFGIEVYHSTGDPIGRNLKKYFDDLRPPYAPMEQHLNVIYFAKNIDKDMGKIPFKYAEELTIIYADSDPSYSSKDLYGDNPTFVRIPVSFETSADRMWIISLKGSVEQAFLDAYPDDAGYARDKAKAALPMLYRLLNERGWGLYAQGLDTNNPTVKVVDEEDVVGSFFTLYPYTQTDVDR
ncbi:DUF4302 domain-containing protein [Bacteroides xylanisolvens]|jgi:hypothetical protein|nr:hypothetical protein BSIG_3172 [Bacteroides thetaiotaomicron]QUR42057.1 DUF4302 domain-containing protein [Bacteroides xylanisolvens]